jgi:hypothetical protein
MACAKNNSWTETVWGTREFLEIYEISVFQEKKWLGKFQYSSFGNHKKFQGLEMPLKLRQSSWSSEAFTIGVEKKAREGIPKLQCS